MFETMSSAFMVGNLTVDQYIEEQLVLLQAKPGPKLPTQYF